MLAPPSTQPKNWSALTTGESPSARRYAGSLPAAATKESLVRAAAGLAAELAAQQFAAYRRLSEGAKAGFKKMMSRAAEAGFFKRCVYIPDLWQVCDSLLVNVAQVKGPGAGEGRGSFRWVRCAPTFENEVRKVWSDHVHFGPDPVGALGAMFRAFVPCSSQVFKGAYAPLHLLHMNDYVMEKAFVFGVIALSKWLGPERFPQGIYGDWPPCPPPPPASHAIAGIEVEAE